jgi:hypothetical protein
VPVFEHETGGAGGLGGPRDAAQVADVGYAIERNQEARRVAREERFELLFRIGIGDRTHAVLGLPGANAYSAAREQSFQLATRRTSISVGQEDFVDLATRGAQRLDHWPRSLDHG